ncbi:unnamed protein product [Rhizoctonia solani]|uniref:Peptidase S8/S53 domain-containing protein n=1 Tax=Rhizoctonia solani TaxID=456999 RepID=A0A8H3C6L3_9AGAM|nr:unnamed protein product [Rhizoctonia solani]
MMIAPLLTLVLFAWSSNGLALPSIPFTEFESTSQSFIVKLKPGHSCQSHFSRIKGSLNKVESSRATHFDPRIFNGYAIELNDRVTLKSLSLLDSVEYIEPDVAFSVASLMTQTNAPWGLHAITHSVSFPTRSESSAVLNYTYEYDSSAGQAESILITPILRIAWIIVPFLPVIRRQEMFLVMVGSRVPTCFSARADHERIAAGTRFGVAKQARIIDVKVITDTGRGFASDIIAGLSWAVAYANSTGRPSVFNLSLGGGTSTALDDAVTGIVNAGIHTIVAAGNADVDASGWSPARVPGVIAVGNIDISGLRSETSNYGSPVAVFAPGVNITSAGINGPTSSRVDSGTSMAAPHVAGLIAYLIGLEGQRTPSEMKTRVQALARVDVLSGIPNGTANLMSQNTL